MNMRPLLKRLRLFGFCGLAEHQIVKYYVLAPEEMPETTLRWDEDGSLVTGAILSHRFKTSYRFASSGLAYKK